MAANSDANSQLSSWKSFPHAEQTKELPSEVVWRQIPQCKVGAQLHTVSTLKHYSKALARTVGGPKLRAWTRNLHTLQLHSVCVPCRVANLLPTFRTGN